MERKNLAWAIGIDVGGSFIKSGLVCNNGSISHFSQKPTPQDIFGFKQAMADIVTGLMKRQPVTGIGIGMPGLINLQTQRVIYMPHLINLTKLDLIKFITTNYKLPCLIDNDAHCFLIGKLVFKKRYQGKTIVLLTLGTGTGSAIAIKGKMYSGNRISVAGFGEMIIDSDGEVCSCKRRGCLNAYLGEVNRKNKTCLDTLELKKLCDHGDQTSLQIIKEMGNKLGIGSANIINLLRPDYLIITGGVAKCFRYMKASFFESLNQNIFGGIKNTVTKIEISKQYIEGGVLGAGGLVLTGKSVYLN